MNCKLIELSELERVFYKTSKIGTAIDNAQPMPVLPAKKIKIRECADLRYWWDDECDSECTQLETAG